MLAGRAVQAFGAGGIFPVASAVIGDTLPPEKRGRGLSGIDSHQLPQSLYRPGVWPLLLAELLALIATATVERRAADPVLRLSWFASRQIQLVALFAAGAGLGEAAMVFMPDLAVRALGITAQD